VLGQWGLARSARRDDGIEFDEEIREKLLGRSLDGKCVLILGLADLATALDNALQERTYLAPVGVKGVGQMHADLVFMDGGLYRNQPGHGIGRLEPRYRFAEGFHDCV
jgi:hypothetical protein